MCQVYTGAYVSLFAAEKTNYTACHLKTLPRTEYILHVVSYPYGCTRQTHVNWKNGTKDKKEENRKERKMKAKTKNEIRAEKNKKV